MRYKRRQHSALASCAAVSLLVILLLATTEKVNCFVSKHQHHQQHQQHTRIRKINHRHGGASSALSVKRLFDRETLTTSIIRNILDQLKDSAFIEEKHLEHVQSDSVTHLFQNTPLAQLPDQYKLQFVNSWAGKSLERIMKEEQLYLGEWKIEKIIQAAAQGRGVDSDDYYYSKEAQDTIHQHITSGDHTIVMYSFVDCPWCVAARTLLEQEYPHVPLLVVELESLQQLGKAIRAELAMWTGRTSMPCIIVNGRPIGGFTDGAPYCGPGLKQLHESKQLKVMLLSRE